MDFLRNWTFLNLQKTVDYLLAVVEHGPQLLPAAITRSMMSRNGIGGVFPVQIL
jgi:hypothetical protein